MELEKSMTETSVKEEDSREGKETKRRRVQKFGSLDYGELRKGSDLIVLA